MTNDDKQRFFQIMAALAEDCSATLSKEGLTMKFKALSGFTISQIESAVISVMRNNVYTKMPTTGTIIQAITGTKEDRAEIQIAEINKEVSRVGWGGSPEFKDPITSELVSRRFGWNRICAMTYKEFDFFTRDFKSAYLAYNNEIERPMIDIQNADLKKLVNNISGELSEG